MAGGIQDFEKECKDVSNASGDDSRPISIIPDPSQGDNEPNVPDLEAIHRSLSGPRYSVFTKRQKQYIIFLTAWGGFFSPLSANIYFPALNVLAKDLSVSSGVINLTLTSYMIFQGFAPTIFGDLSDMFGRRPAYILGFIIYIGANIGLALQNNYAALFILRCMQSTGSSGTVALGNGVVADIATSGERGKYIGYAQFGPMAAPALAPVVGGLLCQFLGWRALFWFLTIAAVVYMIPFCVTFPETGRNVVDNGSVPPPLWNMSVINYLQSRQKHNVESLGRTFSRQEKKATQAELARHRQLRWPNPMKTLHIIAEKDVSIILLYNSLIYTAFYDVTASLPSLFATIYGFNELQIGKDHHRLLLPTTYNAVRIVLSKLTDCVWKYGKMVWLTTFLGLCFIPFGFGCTAASIAGGYLMDFNYKRCARKAGFKIDIKRGDNLQHFPLEKARIQVIWPLLYFGIVATLAYGWALEKNAHLAVPLVLQFVIGLSFTGSFNVMSTMLVDLYPHSPATATAANNLVRCLMGAAGTAVIIQMIDGMGRGWCFTFIAAVVFISSPLLWVETKWGPQWREERRVRIEKHRQKANLQIATSQVPQDGKEEKV